MKRIKLKEILADVKPKRRSSVATMLKKVKLPNTDTGILVKLSVPFQGKSEIVIIPTFPQSNHPAIICDINGQILKSKSHGINYVDVLKDIGYSIEPSPNNKSLPTTHPEYGITK
jgi:hypothetical protein